MTVPSVLIDRGCRWSRASINLLATLADVCSRIENVCDAAPGRSRGWSIFGRPSFRNRYKQLVTAAVLVATAGIRLSAVNGPGRCTDVLQ